MTATPLLRLVALAVTAALVAATWEDGKLEVGEHYPRTFGKFYAVYRLPFGLSFVSTARRVGGTTPTTQLLLRHTPCPNGRDCDASAAENVIIEVNEEVTVLKKTPIQVTQEWQFQPTTSAVLPGSGANGGIVAPVWAKVEQIPGSRFALVDADTGAVRSAVADGTTMVVAANPATNRTHAAVSPGSPGDPAKLNIFDEQAAVVASADLRSTIPTAIVAIPSLGDGFLATRTAAGQVELLRYSEIDPATSVDVIPLVGDSSVVGLVVDEDRHFLYVFRQNTSELDPADLSRTTHLDISLYNISAGVFDHITTGTVFDTWLYTGGFVRNGYLWVYNAAAQLIRMPLNMVGFPEPLTLCTRSAQCTFDKSQRPVLYVASVDDNEVWFGADWTGELINVNLQHFCADYNCQQPNINPPSGPPGGSMWGLAVVLPLVIVFTGVAVYGRRKGWWDRFAYCRRRRQYEEIRTAHPANAALPAMSAHNAVTDSHL